MTDPLQQHIDWYLDVLRARPASPATVHTYGSALARLERFCSDHGVQRIEDLNAETLTAAVIETLRDGTRDGNHNNKGNEGLARMLVTAARGLCRELRARHAVQAPDLSVVRTPRLPERIQPSVELEDFERMQAALANRAAYPRFPRLLLARDAALVQLLFETGLRAAECSRLNVSDLDLERRLVTVQRGKGGRPRRLSILDPNEPDDGGETLRRLRSYLAERRGRPGEHNRALWIGARGARLSPGGLRKVLHTLCDESGTGNRPVHAFRRGWFTAAYRAEPRDLPVLAARMGWSTRSQQMVAIYTRGAMLDFAAMPRPLISRPCIVRDARDR